MMKINIPSLETATTTYKRMNAFALEKIEVLQGTSMIHWNISVYV